MVKLNDKQLKALLRKGEPGKHALGGGLYFRISAEGTAFWVLRYTINGKRRESSIGRYPAKPLAAATLEAAQLKEGVRSGIDPLAEKKRPDAITIKTVDDLAEDWLRSDVEPRLKHPRIPRRVYTQLLSPSLGELSLERVTPMDVRQAVEAITASGRPTIANDALMYCKQLFRHGIRLGLMQSNPAEAFTVRHAGGVETSRDRALTVDELRTVFRVLRANGDCFTRENYLAVALLVTLGVRKTELTAAQWSEFDLDAAIWRLPAERSKTGIGLDVPLPAAAVEWLRELKIRALRAAYVFPARRASKRRGYISDDTLNHALAKLFGQKARPANKFGEAGVEHFVVHDLRRTCRSLLASLGVPGHVAERVLNHKLRGVAGIYDRHDYFDERRDALDQLAGLVAPIINAEDER